MSRGARSETQLAMEAAARRVALREEQEAHSRTLTALREANRELLRVVLASRLEHPGDLELYVDLEYLTDETGRLVWTRVHTVVDTLLVDRPNLATPTEQASPRSSEPAATLNANGLG